MSGAETEHIPSSLQLAAAAVGQSESSSAGLHDLLAALREPFQEHLVSQLTAGTVAALRATCSSMYSLVDTCQAHQLRPSLGQVLPPAILPYATFNSTLWSMVQQQAMVIADLKSPQVSDDGPDEEGGPAWAAAWAHRPGLLSPTVPAA